VIILHYHFDVIPRDIISIYFGSTGMNVLRDIYEKKKEIAGAACTAHYLALCYIFINYYD